MFSTIKRHRAGTFAAAAAIALGVVAAATAPASAIVLDTDHPKITKSHFDFGTNWVLGAPVNGGDLKWDLINGYTYPKLTGYLYLTDQECAYVKATYYQDAFGNHTLLGSRSSSVYCAPGNGKTQFWISLTSYFSTSVDHVHVDIMKRNSNGTYSSVGSDIEDFD